MIDTHCHILPGIDDGAEDWEASLAMARTAVEDGIQQVIATPHWTGRPGEMEQMEDLAQELTRLLDAAGIKLRLHLGNEVVLVPRLVEALAAGQARCLGATNYVLLETAHFERGAYMLSALFQLQSAGYRLVLAHPERLRSWQKDPSELKPFIERNCLLQVTAGSLLGEFGGAAQRTAELIVKRGWASLLASDGHSPNSRPLKLSAARRRCEQLIGPAAAASLVEENPARLLCNDQLPYVELETEAEPGRTILHRLFGR